MPYIDAQASLNDPKDVCNRQCRNSFAQVQYRPAHQKLMMKLLADQTPGATLTHATQITESPLPHGDPCPWPEIRHAWQFQKHRRTVRDSAANLALMETFLLRLIDNCGISDLPDAK